MKTKVSALLLALVSALSCAPRETASTQPTPPTPPAAKAHAAPAGVGDTAPDFTLEDERGRKVTLSQARGKTPVVLVFYRGHW